MCGVAQGWEAVVGCGLSGARRRCSCLRFFHAHTLAECETVCSRVPSVMDKAVGSSPSKSHVLASGDDGNKRRNAICLSSLSGGTATYSLTDLWN